MYKVGKIEIKNALLLAPMEDVTGIAFRKICKELGADVVFTEFVNSDGLVRNNKKTSLKMKITGNERPVGIQIYGGNLEPMIESALISEKENPDLIDINAGCWVKKIAGRGAGAGLLKDLPYLQKMVGSIVNAVKLPVTVKTRIGWDKDSINIEEAAKRIEDAGAAALTIHCRTRSEGHSGVPDWNWIPVIKNIVKIPVILNGGIFSAEDVKYVFDNFAPDGVMIARGAIDHPWIFREAKELMEHGSVLNPVSTEERILTALRHLKYELDQKEESRRAIFPFRKYYSGYLKGLYNASKIRQVLVRLEDFGQIEETLMNYLSFLNEFRDKENAIES